MEQIIQNILKSQGYEKIGLIDKEKRIWCYLKNGAIHFCNDDLKPVDWCSFAKDKNLLVLSEIDGSFIIVHDRDVFTNFMVIDNNNRVFQGN